MSLFRILASALALVAASTAGAQRADLILVNGDVVTVDSAHPRAQAIAVAGDRIIAVGSNADIRKLADARTKRVDARGRLVIPAFIEGHGHFLSLGESKTQVDLTHAKNWDDIVARVAGAVETAPRGALIRGFGWHQEKWDRVPQ